MSAPYWLATALYCAGLFWLSADSTPIVPAAVFPGQDKAAHAVLYAGLAAVVSVGVRRSRQPKPPAAQFWIPLLFACFYGMTDEIHQIFVPNRVFDPWDIAADALGAAAVQAVLCGYLWRRSRRA